MSDKLSNVQLNPLKIINLPINKIVPNVNNTRTHSREQIDKIAASMIKFGFNDPIAIDLMNVIISGHGRLEAAKLIGLVEVPTIQLGHLDKNQQRAYVIAHNRISLDAGWDNDLLEIEMQELKDAGFDLVQTGFDDDEIMRLLNPEIICNGHVDADIAPPVKKEPISVLGDIWVLDNHRVMCGDSTNPNNVQDLIKESNPIMMITDPPYGVHYEPEWRDMSGFGIGENSDGKVENDDRVDWTDAYSLFTGDICYVWHAGLFTGDVSKHLKDCGFDLINQIIWVKQHFAISRGDYHWQHEPCWYGVRKGKKHNWQGARDQSTTWEIANNNYVGNCNIEQTFGHGTQKPIECMARPIQNNSRPKDTIYDPFGGSGTTLIACEKFGRYCVMMEISPQYVDVIVKRWQDFTGKKAIHEQSGKSFEELDNERTATGTTP